MKTQKMKYLPIAVAIFFSVACGNKTEAGNKVETAMDPVCNMAKDSTWTEYAVNGADTVWFCSPHCKDVYSANPDKFNKQ